MANTKAKPMIEGGILGAVLVAIAVMSLYIPFVHMVWSIPIALIGARHGLRYSVLTAIVATLVIVLTVHIVQGLWLLLGGALTGVVLGACLRGNLTGMQTAVFTTIAACISTLAVFGASMVFMDIDAMQMTEQIQTMMMDTMQQVSLEMGADDAQHAHLMALGAEMSRSLVMLFPSGLIVYALCCTIVNLAIIRIIMRRLQMHTVEFPSFAHWRFSGWVLYLFVLSLVGTYWGNKWLSDTMVVLAENVRLITSLALFIEGLAVVYYVKCRNRLLGRIWWLLVVFAILSPLLNIALIVLGGIDILMNYRKIGEKQV